MGKYWSFFFGIVLLACLGLFIVAPLPGVGWWLPKNVSSFGGEVDGLFYFILVITGFFFILTEALLVYFMYAYAYKPRQREHPVGHHYAENKVYWTTFFKRMFRPVSAVLHNQHRVEMTWTLIPGVILLIIAFAQVNAWQNIKDPANMPRIPDVPMEVSARMYEWRIRYPVAAPDTPEKVGAWAEKAQSDDIHMVNEIHCWKGAKVKVFLKSRDVIHSFYLPNLRLKQDALPGKTIPVWFQVTEYNTVPVDDKGQRLPPGDPRAVQWRDNYYPDQEKLLTPEEDHGQTWELACAELCGWGHYKMRGKLYVHENKADYDAWLKHAQAQQQQTKP